MLPRPYRLAGESVIRRIVELGLAGEFGEMWGELQFAPTDGRRGVMRMRGGDVGFRQGFCIRLGPYWLYYKVDDDDKLVRLVDLIPIL